MRGMMVQTLRKTRAVAMGKKRGSQLRPAFASSTTLLAVIIFTLNAKSGQALPQIIVQSGKPKCFSVMVPAKTRLQIDYDAPDLSDKGPHKGPTWLTVHMTKPAYNLRDGATAAEHHEHRQRISKIKPTSEELKKKTGTFFHDVDLDGELDVCVRASAAGSRNPMRFGLMVSVVRDAHAEKIEKEMSGLELQTARLSEHMSQILAEADYAKEREMAYHDMSVSMNAASMWWPIMQLCVLLMMGFTQAWHVVQFFKSRHII